jgi:predicted transcriptional regulator
MIEQLFGSKTRVKLLRLFFTNPNRSFYVREITRKVDEQINSVRRELANLLSIGIISSDTSNNKLYYKVNATYTFYTPLKQMFGDISQTRESVGDEEAAIASGSDMALWKQAGNASAVVYTGLLMRNARSEVDILVIGDVNASKVAKIVEKLENVEKKELRYTIMTSDEWEYRRQIKDRFYETIHESKIQVIMDRQNLFTK